MPIKAEGIAAKNAAGETLSEYHAADISAIEVAFSKALAPGTVNAESVKLYKGYEDVSLAAEVSCGNDNKAVVVKPAGPLEDASLYRVVLSDAVKDSEGNSIGRNRGRQCAEPLPGTMAYRTVCLRAAANRCTRS